MEQGMSSVFFNKGENCIAAGRLFVEEAVHDEFVGRVIEECKKMVSKFALLILSWLPWNMLLFIVVKFLPMCMCVKCIKNRNTTLFQIDIISF